MKKYEKSHSNYILRNLQTSTSAGNVYENDLRTDSQKYNNVNGKITYTTDGGFTYVINNDETVQKNYNTSGWREDTFTLSGSSLLQSDIKTLQDGKTELVVKKVSSLKKNSENLADYCYYGSANAMLNASINNIITNFPAGINIISCESGNTITTEFYQNPFGIDVSNYDISELISKNYSLRVLATSYYDYELVRVTQTGETHVSDISGFSSVITSDAYQMHSESGNTITMENGNFSLLELYSQSLQTYMITLNLTETNPYTSDLILRPKTQKIDEFFNNLDDFESVLLNRYSIPKYTSKFTIPTDDGGLEVKTLTWDTSDGYNIDIDTPSYAIYLNYLINSTNFIDSLYNDNLYRLMTHESIKNLENITTLEKNQEIEDSIVIGGSKVDSLIRIYGKNFDEIKAYIDGISSANCISYDKKNNIPSEFIPNKYGTSGWEFNTEINISGDTNANIFNHTTKSFNSQEILDDLYSKLILNSKYIFKSKGTVKSIRKLMNILGIDESWYKIKECYQKVDSFITGSTLRTIAELNYNITPEIYYFDDTKEPFKYYYSEALFKNTNIGLFIKCPICGSQEYLQTGYEEYASGRCDNGHTFLLTEAMVGYPKHTNRQSFYFQQKGSWYKETGGVHNDVSGFTYVNETNIGNNPHIGNGAYDSGYDYINQFTDVFKEYSRGTNEFIVTSGYSNYGFEISKKKTFGGEKISGSTNNLIMNLKNVIIGIDCQSVIKSFYQNNSTVNTITQDATANCYDKNIFITNTISPIDVLCDSIPTGNTCKIYNDINNENEANIYSILTHQGDPYVLLPGEMAIIIDGNVLPYNGEDEYNLLKSIILGYIEQVIPSTALFTFVKIGNEPIWSFVDEYDQKNNDGSYNGYHAVAYQNINYFDVSSTTYNQELEDMILKNHGDGYVFYEQQLFINDDNQSTNGYDNIYVFRKKVNNQEINTNPIWVPNI